MSESTQPTLQEVLTARIGETVSLYGRSDFVITSVHSREAHIDAPKTRKHPAVRKYPKLRTLAAALEIPVATEQTEPVAA